MKKKEMHEEKNVSGNELQLRKRDSQVAVMLKGDRKKKRKRPDMENESCKILCLP